VTLKPGLGGHSGSSKIIPFAPASMTSY